MNTEVKARTRRVYNIGDDIAQHWQNPYFGAVPYIKAMREISSPADHKSVMTDRYHADSVESVLLYFLSNAATWRGEHARRIKAEIKSLLGQK